MTFQDYFNNILNESRRFLAGKQDYFNKLLNESRRVLTGKFSKKEHIIYVFAIFVFFVLCLIISQALFPGDFNIINNKISEQGNPILNPTGHWFFNIGALITGLLIVPSFLYLYRRISILPGSQIFRKFTKMSIGFSVIGSIGLAFVGIFPEIYGWFHIIAADVTFGGLCGGAFIIFFMIVIKKSFRNRLKSKWHLLIGFILLYGQLILVWIFSGVLMFIKGTWWAFFDYAHFLLGHPLLEWAQFISIIIWMLGLPLLLSDNIFEPKKMNP
jgi:hypothetical membrane protein